MQKKEIENIYIYIKRGGRFLLSLLISLSLFLREERREEKPPSLPPDSSPLFSPTFSFSHFLSLARSLTHARVISLVMEIFSVARRGRKKSLSLLFLFLSHPHSRDGNILSRGGKFSSLSSLSRARARERVELSPALSSPSLSSRLLATEITSVAREPQGELSPAIPSHSYFFPSLRFSLDFSLASNRPPLLLFLVLFSFTILLFSLLSHDGNFSVVRRKFLLFISLFISLSPSPSLLRRKFFRREEFSSLFCRFCRSDPRVDRTDF